MRQWLGSLDRILRGEVTKPEALRDGSIDLPIRGLTIIIVVLAMIYGLCMGSFSLFKTIDPSVGGATDRFLQIVASMLKVPALYLLTLVVTFPSLYVFNALVGSRLNFGSMLRLLIASLAVNLAVLASLGPITAFFSVSTTSYRFMQMFNVVVFAISGALGLVFLNQTLNRLSQKTVELLPEETPPRRQPEPTKSSLNELEKEKDSIDEELTKAELVTTDVPAKPGALDKVQGHMLSQHVRLVFRIWIVAFCLVGAQMGWVLRPFIGNPGQAFEWFRDRKSNFFLAILDIISQLLTGS